MFKDKFQCYVHTFIPLCNGASIPIFIFFHFYLVLIGILHWFFVGAVVSPHWFSTGMKFCKITSEPFIFILQFVNGCVPWMFPVNAVHALRRKETITEKSVPRKWCIFSVRLDPNVGKTLSFESSDVALFCVPPKSRFPPLPPHDTDTQWQLPLNTLQ